jgi:hypothetical protein
MTRKEIGGEINEKHLDLECWRGRRRDGGKIQLSRIRRFV